MIKRTISTIFLLVSLNYLFAQKAPIKFGDVTQEELKMTKYPADTSAVAVILMDYGDADFEYNQSAGFQVVFNRIVKIKILKKEGYEWGNFEIPLYHTSHSDKEKITNLKGSTFNLVNNKIDESKIKMSDAFEEKVDKNWDLIKVALPNVKVGSVVELTYKITSDFLFNFRNWKFQNTIPVEHSEYRASIPEYFTYEKYMQGYVNLAVNEQKSESKSIAVSYQSDASTGRTETGKLDFQSTTYRWIANQVPAFISEPYMTSSKDYISMIKFELSYIKYPNSIGKTIMGTWSEISKKFDDDEDFGGEVRGNSFLKRIVEELISSCKTPEEKIAAITKFVTSNFVWNEYNGIYSESPMRKIFDNKTGSAAEINLLLASMLRKAGLDAYPVLLSTRDHGFVRTAFPVASQFNYVVCLVEYGNNKMLLDGTSKLSTVGQLPKKCLNGQGLVIQSNGERWTSLDSPIKSKSSISSEFEINNAGQLVGSLEVKTTGYYGYENRAQFFKKGEDNFFGSFLGEKSWTVTNKKVQNADVFHEPFIHQYELEIDNQITNAGDRMYLNPLVVTTHNENPFKLENRLYPVDFGAPFDEVYITKIKLPNGYEVEEMPESKIISLPQGAGRFIYNIAKNENVMNITVMLSINKAIFTQNEYTSLREFYNLMISKQSEQIVIKKI